MENAQNHSFSEEIRLEKQQQFYLYVQMQN